MVKDDWYLVHRFSTVATQSSEDVSRWIIRAEDTSDVWLSSQPPLSKRVIVSEVALRDTNLAS